MTILPRREPSQCSSPLSPHTHIHTHTHTYTHTHTQSRTRTRRHVYRHTQKHGHAVKACLSKPSLQYLRKHPAWLKLNNEKFQNKCVCYVLANVMTYRVGTARAPSWWPLASIDILWKRHCSVHTSSEQQDRRKTIPIQLTFNLFYQMSWSTCYVHVLCASVVCVCYVSKVADICAMWALCALCL